MGEYGKQFDEKQMERVLSCEHVRNPLYAVTFLQEIRTFGVYEQVNARIDYYLSATSLSGLFTKVIERLEEDFDVAVPDMVRWMLTFLCLARQGLGENELKGLLARALHLPGDDDLPALEFSAVMLRLEHFLINRRGLRKFAHPFMEEAVGQRYFSHDEHLTAHRLMAAYFEAQPVNTRRVEELPYHLYAIASASHVSSVSIHDFTDVPEVNVKRATLTPVAPAAPPPSTDPGSRNRSRMASLSSTRTSSKRRSVLVDKAGHDLTDITDRLQNCLTNLDMFQYLQQAQFVFDLHRYWRLLETRGVSNLAGLYAAKLHEWKLTNPPSGDYAERCEQLATFLIDTNRFEYEREVTDDTNHQGFLSFLLSLALEHISEVFGKYG